MEETNEYMSIVGIKTKGGFPTIECKEFQDVEAVETKYRFFDRKLGIYYAYKEGFFFSWCNGQTDLNDPKFDEPYKSSFCGYQQ